MTKTLRQLYTIYAVVRKQIFESFKNTRKYRINISSLLINNWYKQMTKINGPKPILYMSDTYRIRCYIHILPYMEWCMSNLFLTFRQHISLVLAENVIVSIYYIQYSQPVARKHFFKNFQKFGSECFQIS